MSECECVFVRVWTVRTLYHVITDSHPQNYSFQTETSYSNFPTLMVSELLCFLAFFTLQTIEVVKETVYWINFFFTLLFTAEAILKMTALHPVVHIPT